MSENNEHLLSMNLVVCDSCSGKYVFNCKVFSKSIIWNVIIWCLLVLLHTLDKFQKMNNLHTRQAIPSIYNGLKSVLEI